MRLEQESPCKVNLLLNILGKRPDGFHELETVIQPLQLCDHLTLEATGREIELTCTDPNLPTDSSNLVHRAATAFLGAARISTGVRIHLEKKLPIAAGLGAGSANAATTLLALNRLFEQPLDSGTLHQLAATLGSDVPFFLQSRPALATGRGEKVEPLEPFAALRGAAFLLIYPGFGVPTPWAYQQLARFLEAVNGRTGRARRLIELLQKKTLRDANAEFYNALEYPVLHKYPLLQIFQEFLRTHGAVVALMSGSGSTTFGIFDDESTARSVEAEMKKRFSPAWTAAVAM